MNNIWILAEAGNNAGDEIGSTPANGAPIDTVNDAVVGADGSQPVDGQEVVPPKPAWLQFAPIIVLFVVMYFMLIKGPKKKQKKHTQMVKSMAKNAKIQTIGGIIGTVIEIRENEIIIKIDESNNTKMRITKGAVSTVLSDDNK